MSSCSVQDCRVGIQVRGGQGPARGAEELIGLYVWRVVLRWGACECICGPECPRATDGHGVASA